MSLAAILAAVTGYVDAVSGIASASNGPADQANELPAVMVWPLAPTAVVGASAEGGYTIVRPINVRLLVERNSDLPTEYGRLVPFLDAIPPALAAHVTLGGLAHGCRYVGERDEPGMTTVGNTTCVTTDLLFEVKYSISAPFGG